MSLFEAVICEEDFALIREWIAKATIPELQTTGRKFLEEQRRLNLRKKIIVGELQRRAGN